MTSLMMTHLSTNSTINNHARLFLTKNPRFQDKIVGDENMALFSDLPTLFKFAYICLPTIKYTGISHPNQSAINAFQDEINKLSN